MSISSDEECPAARVPTCAGAQYKPFVRDSFDIGSICEKTSSLVRNPLCWLCLFAIRAARHLPSKLFQDVLNGVLTPPFGNDAPITFDPTLGVNAIHFYLSIKSHGWGTVWVFWTTLYGQAVDAIFVSCPWRAENRAVPVCKCDVIWYFKA